MGKLSIFFAVLFLFWGVFSRAGVAQDIETTWDVGDDVVTVGDVVTIGLTVGHPAGWRMIAPPFEERWGDWEVVRVETVAVKPIDDGEREVSVQAVAVRGWEPGVVRGTEMFGQISTPDGELQTLQIAPFELEIMSVLQTGDEALRDIKPQAEMEIIESNRVWWLVGLGALVLGSVAGILMLVRGRRPNILTTQSSYEVAIAELDELRSQDVRELGARRYYAEVTDVVRRYVERTSGIVATKRTSSELDRALERAGFSDGGRERLRPLLRQADMVKFAKVEPSHGSAREFVDAAEQFVQKTESMANHAHDSHIEGDVE